MTEPTISLAAVEQLCLRALMAAGTREENAAAVARSTMLAARGGIRSHGLLYVPIYAEHVRCDGMARPLSLRLSSDMSSKSFRSSLDDLADIAIDFSCSGWAFICAL